MHNSIKAILNEQVEQNERDYKVLNKLFPQGITVPFEFSTPNDVEDEDSFNETVIKGTLTVVKLHHNTMTIMYQGTYDDGYGEETLEDLEDGGQVFGVYYMDDVVREAIFKRLDRFGIKSCNIIVMQSMTYGYLVRYNGDHDKINFSKVKLEDASRLNESDGKFITHIEKAFMGKELDFGNGRKGWLTKVEQWAKKLHVTVETNSQRPSDILEVGEKMRDKIRNYFNISVSVSVSSRDKF